MRGGLSVTAIDFAYEVATPVLQQVDLVAQSGQMVALLGPNGSGKSTLLRVLAGLLPATSGRATWQGDDLIAMDRLERARRVSYLPQRVGAVHRHFAREVVELARHPHRPSGFGRLGPEDQRVIEESLVTVDAVALASRPFDELSGGERQRVLLAAALAQGGDLLLLDEPTSALDLPHQVSFFARLRELVDGGRTVLVATHDLNLAAVHADRALWLEAGRVAASGSADEVLCESTLRPLLGDAVWIGPHPQGRVSCVLPRGPRS